MLMLCHEINFDVNKDTLYNGERNGDLMGVSTRVIFCRQTPV